MNARVFVMIADYFKRMHDEVVWPTASSRPPGQTQTPTVHPPVWGGDRLVEIRHTLLKSYVKSVQVFDTARPCTTTYDCLNQGEVCIGGECRIPPPDGSANAVDSLGLLHRCTTTWDCLNQGEVCVNGVCVVDPYGLEPVDPTFNIDGVYL